jgi:outer membrane protein assembly factor BamB
VAEDWPQFRGPGGEGHSSERDVPLEWSESRNILWKTPVVGRGWSSPVVAGGRVWLTTAVVRNDNASLRVLAFDVQSGREIVNVEAFAVRGAFLKNAKNSFASPTPVVEGDRVYVHFGSDGTAALSTDGKILWKTVLKYESMHGNGGSPTLYAIC